MANRVIELLRTNDLLVLEFAFINLELLDTEGAQPVRFMRLDPAQPGLIIVRFLSQHLAEPDFHEAPPTAKALFQPPTAARSSG